MKEGLQRLFDTIDRMDADGFVLFLTEDACFRFANTPPANGRKNIHNAVSNFFSGIEGLHHRILEVWEHDDIVVCEGEVTYIRHDARELTFPFVNIFRMKNDLIADYRIYADTSPLFS